VYFDVSSPAEISKGKNFEKNLIAAVRQVELRCIRK
jgi:hypothetical protein